MNRRSSSVRRIVLLALAVRVVYALALNVTDSYHGDELNNDVGGQLAAGLKKIQAQREISLFRASVGAETFQSNRQIIERRNLPWIINAVKDNPLSSILYDTYVSGSINFPLFYFWIGTFYFLFGYVPILYRLVSAIAGAFEVYVVYRISEEMGLGDMGRKVTSLLYALLPLGFQYSGTFYKEPIAGLLFLLMLLLWMERRLWLLGLVGVCLSLLRPASFMAFFVLTFGSAVLKKPSVRRLSLALLVILLALPMPTISVGGRNLGSLFGTVQNTSLLSNLPVANYSLGTQLLTVILFGIIGLIQPVPFLYGYDVPLNHLTVMWTLGGIEWAIMGPIVISSIFLVYKYRGQVRHYEYIVMAGVLMLIVAGFAVAGPEAVRYRDSLYPIGLIAVGWNLEKFGQIRKIHFVYLFFYAAFISALAYAIYRMVWP